MSSGITTKAGGIVTRPGGIVVNTADSCGYQLVPCVSGTGTTGLTLTSAAAQSYGVTTGNVVLYNGVCYIVSSKTNGTTPVPAGATLTPLSDGCNDSQCQGCPSSDPGNWSTAYTLTMTFLSTTSTSFHHGYNTFGQSGATPCSGPYGDPAVVVAMTRAGGSPATWGGTSTHTCPGEVYCPQPVASIVFSPGAKAGSCFLLSVGGRDGYPECNLSFTLRSAPSPAGSYSQVGTDSEGGIYSAVVS